MPDADRAGRQAVAVAAAAVAATTAAMAKAAATAAAASTARFQSFRTLLFPLCSIFVFSCTFVIRTHAHTHTHVHVDMYVAAHM